MKLSKQQQAVLWKPIKGFGKRYKVSNKGDIISIGRIVNNKGTFGKKTYIKPARILKQSKTSDGYSYITLHYNGKSIVKKTHTLVWDAFGNKQRNGIKLQVDHIDNNKENNSIENLQILTPRQNSSKSKGSLFVGAHYNKANKNYQAKYKIGNKTYYIGCFKTAKLAHKAYLSEIQNLR